MTNTIKCLLVDDEQPALDLLKTYIESIPTLSLVGMCHSAIEASKFLKESSVDLIFLDIEMPMLNGLDFLKNSSSLPKVIVTTAYREYAVEGYDLDIVDYLLKPISFQRFYKAVERYYDRIIPIKNITNQNEAAPVKDYMFVNVNKKSHKIYFNDISYIESIKDYTRIHLKDKKITVKGNLGSILNQLPKDDFIRVHRSFIISKSKITAFTSHDIEIETVEIPIGQTYKHVLHQLK